MPGLTVAVVTFTETKEAAVGALLNDLDTNERSPWRRVDNDAVERQFGDDLWRLQRIPVRAQGNVVAAAKVAELFTDQRPPDYIVFYGCAGAVDPGRIAEPFLVSHVNYLSLGTVESQNGREHITLKNKWLCHLQPKGDVEPLDAVSFPLTNGTGPLDLTRLTGIPVARVAASDKVIRIPPDAFPPPLVPGPPHSYYARAEWSYGQALGFVAEYSPVTIVEMESYGIGRIAAALKIENKVTVLRITTDSLVDHLASDGLQHDLLMRGRPVLAQVVGVLFNPVR